MSLQSCPFLLPAMILSQAWLNVTSQEAEMATCFSDSEDEILDESFSIVPYNIEPVMMMMMNQAAQIQVMMKMKGHRILLGTA